MNEIRYFVDEHVAPAVVRGLLQRGIDVISVSDAGSRGASDEELLAYALAAGRVIFSQDEDFLRLSATGHPHAGIVFAAQGTPIGELIRGLTLIAQVLSAQEMHGHVEFL